MTSLTFIKRELIDVDNGDYQLWARIFQAMADQEAFAVDVATHNGSGKTLQVFFYSDPVSQP